MKGSNRIMRQAHEDDLGHRDEGLLLDLGERLHQRDDDADAERDEHQRAGHLQEGEDAVTGDVEDFRPS